VAVLPTVFAPVVEPKPFSVPVGVNPFTAAMPAEVPVATLAPSPSIATTADSQVISPAQQYDYDYKQIASLQRLSTKSIWLLPLSFVLLTIVVNIIDEPISNGFAIFFMLPASVFLIFCMVRLAKSLQYGLGIIILFAICLPLTLGLIPLFLVYFRAGYVLNQANDAEIGYFRTGKYYSKKFLWELCGTIDINPIQMLHNIMDVIVSHDTWSFRLSKSSFSAAKLVGLFSIVSWDFIGINLADLFRRSLISL
jgi:hypothetical protein